MSEPFLLRRVGRVHRTAEPAPALLESIEERYNLCMLFYCIRKQDEEAEDPKYGAFDWTW